MACQDEEVGWWGFFFLDARAREEEDNEVAAGDVMTNDGKKITIEDVQLCTLGPWSSDLAVSVSDQNGFVGMHHLIVVPAGKILTLHAIVNKEE